MPNEACEACAHTFSVKRLAHTALSFSVGLNAETSMALT